MNKNNRYTYIRLVRTLCGTIALAGLASCASTSGGAYSRSAQGDSSAASIAAQRKKDSQPSPSKPPSKPPPTPERPGASAPARESPEPHLLESLWSARPAHGRIFVRGLPPGARLYVDGIRFWGNSASVEAGNRYVTAEAFGRETWSQTVMVQPRQAVILDAYLPSAAFRVDSLEVSPGTFDADSPGAFGSATFTWSVSAPGTGNLSVLDSSGREAYGVRNISMDSPEGSVVWNGRDSSGGTAPDGVYTARLEGIGYDGTWSVREVYVVVSRTSEPTRYSSLHGGFSGTLFAPDARVLPAGRFQISTGAYALSTPGSGEGAARFPVFGGIRIGGLFGGASELVASALVVPYYGYAGVDPSWGSLSVSLKTQLLSGPTAAALLLSASAASFLDEAASGYPPSWDGPARFPGLGAGIILETSGRRTRLFASLQLEASTYYPGWEDLAWDTPGLFAWGYGRLGAEVLVPGFLGGDLALAASLAARTQPLGTEFDLRPPLSLGAEAHWYVPGTNVVFSAYAAGEWEGFSSWYYAGGLGIGYDF